MKPRAAALPVLLLLTLLGLVACSDASDSSSSDDSGGAMAADAPAAEADGEMSSSDRGAADVVSVAKPSSEPVEVDRAVIRRGNVELHSEDVGKAQFEIQRVADRLSGQITEERTTTDDGGEPAYTRMVLRVPTASFGTAMNALKGVDELESASSSEDDVTAKVIDTRTRLQAQRRSIARITVLFDRASSITDIMRIESELSRRQASLESLERQAAFLRSQTAMSTITVSVDQIPPAAPKEPDTDEAGFVTGLSAGWGALTSFAVGLATAFGALLPWLVVLAVLGVPTLLIWRSRRRASERDPGRTPSAA